MRSVYHRKDVAVLFPLDFMVNIQVMSKYSNYYEKGARSGELAPNSD